jgi:hypothetical protein
MHEARARYENKLGAARKLLLDAEESAVYLGLSGASEDLQSIVIHVNQLMRESLDRKARKPLRDQLSLTDPEAYPAGKYWAPDPK